MFKKTFSVGNTNRLISETEKPFIVAEIGLNHNGDLEIGKKTIEAAKKNGAHAVKFQSYITSEFIDEKNEEAKFLFDIFKKYELSEKMHKEFQKTSADLGLIFFSTPLCPNSVDLLVSLNVPILKIASGDIVNAQLLEKCASTKLPIFLSTGAACLSEIVSALELLQNKGVDKLCLMHCVSVYPAPIDSLNLKTILSLKELTGGPVGFSDHSEGNSAAIVAIAYDACVIEKHFTLDKNLPGPDHSISVSPAELLEFSKKCEEAFVAKGKCEKTLHAKEKDGRFFGRRSLYFDKNGKPVALRPDMSIKDKSIMHSWDYLRLKEIKQDFSKSEFGLPVYFKDMKST